MNGATNVVQGVRAPAFGIRTTGRAVLFSVIGAVVCLVIVVAVSDIRGWTAGGQAFWFFAVPSGYSSGELWAPGSGSGRADIITGIVVLAFAVIFWFDRRKK